MGCRAEGKLSVYDAWIRKAPPGLDGRSFPPQVTTAMHRCLHLTHLTGAQVPDWSG